MSRHPKIPKDNLPPSRVPSSSVGPNTGPSNESSYPKASSRPHPYRYQLHSLTNLDDNNFQTNRLPIVQIPRDTNASNHNTKKPLTNAIGRPQPQPLPPRPPSRHHIPPLSLHLRPLALFIFLPIPPLLSLLYMTAGHTLLRQTQRSSTSIYHHAPIRSSVEAGATGGAILSLPIALLLYLLMSPRQTSVPEDFFEDDDSVTTASARCMMYSGARVYLTLLSLISDELSHIYIYLYDDPYTYTLTLRKIT